MHYPLQPPSWSEIYMGNANWTFIIIKIMISVVSTVIIKMKDENNAKRTLYSLFAVNTEWKINSVLVCRVGVPDRDRGGHVQEVVLPKTSEFARGPADFTPVLRWRRLILSVTTSYCWELSWRQMWLTRFCSFAPLHCACLLLLSEQCVFPVPWGEESASMMWSSKCMQRQNQALWVYWSECSLPHLRASVLRLKLSH